jgi:hypothetical protein
MMDDRPAPRCKRRRYRCALRARPIRMSTVRYTCAYFLRVSRTPDRKTQPRRRCKRSDLSAVARRAKAEAIRLAASYRLSNGIY